MNRKKYTKPELTVVSFKTEQGFASSGSITFTIEQNELYNEQCQKNGPTAATSLATAKAGRRNKNDSNAL